MTVIVDLRSKDATLAALVDRARNGEEVVVVENGTPVARLVPLAASPDTPMEPRQPGSGIGLVRMAPGFDEDLPPELFEALRE